MLGDDDTGGRAADNRGQGQRRGPMADTTLLLGAWACLAVIVVVAILGGRL